MFHLRRAGVFCFVAVLVVGGCANKIPPQALELGPQSLAVRQLETRVYDTDDEQKILLASAGVLQDTGFNIDESEPHLGVIVGSKQRSAVNAGQIVGSFVVSALTGVKVPIDKSQTMRVSLVTRPFGENKTRTAVRVTFQRAVVNDQGQISKREQITDPAVYQEFFDKLSKAIFLEGHAI